MKEIGNKLKETRESMGISLEEAAEDLKIRPAQLEYIEEGNKEAFKDVFYLKFFIRDYAKYLGLNYEEMVEDFNEFLFDYTSKISLDDIKNASKNVKKVKKIKSPYTLEKKPKKQIPAYVIYGLVALVGCVIIYCLVLLITDKTNPKNNDIIINYEESINEFA